MTELLEQQSPRPLKYTLTHYRNPKNTHDEFINWLVSTHIPLVLPVLKKHGVLGYSLFVTPPPLSVALKSEMAKFQPTWDITDSDCVIEYTIPGMQTMKDVIADEGWVVAIKDQDEWVDMSRALVSLGVGMTFLPDRGVGN